MKIAMVMAFLNIVFIFLYRLLEISIPFNVRYLYFLAAVVIISAACSIFRKLSESMIGLQISLFMCFICLSFAEIVFKVSPEFFPENIQHLVETGVSTAKAKENSVELLSYNPYAVPRPNVLIHIPGYYGPQESFVYEWLSDKRGFKNTKEVADHDTMDVVAIGDSFTEGMGVVIDKTFSSRLSKMGILTYSLGVQGYAPFQFQGIYEHYARPLKPKWLMIGYLNGIGARDYFFLKSEKEILAEKSFPSAIGRLVEHDQADETKTIVMETDDGYRYTKPKTRHTFMISALLMLTQYKLTFDITAGVANVNQDARFMKDKKVQGISLELMSRYAGEFKSLKDVVIESSKDFAASPDWISTEKSISKVIQMAKKDGSNVLIVFFPDRGGSYYVKATSEPLPLKTRTLVESTLIKSLAQREKVSFLDLSPAFQNYVSTLTEASRIEDYPYLKVDGHPSEKGHEIIANELSKFFKEQGL